VEVSTLDGVVLAVDYPGPRARTQLRQLKLEGLGWPVRYPLREVLPRKLTATEYADALYTSCKLAEVRVRLVVGYCAAGEIARELAPMCSVFGEQPLLVLLNPERAEDYDVVRTLEMVLRRPLPGSGNGPVRLDQLTPANVEALEQDLADAFTASLPEANRSVAHDVSRMQMTWAIHLIAAARPASVPTASELHIVSPDHLCPDRCPARHLTVAATAGDICAAPAVLERIRAECVEHGRLCPSAR